MKYWVAFYYYKDVSESHFIYIKVFFFFLDPCFCTSKVGVTSTDCLLIGKILVCGRALLGEIEDVMPMLVWSFSFL